MRRRLWKIISGGQTGADLGALVGARRIGLETGGTAPNHGLAKRVAAIIIEAFRAEGS